MALFGPKSKEYGDLNRKSIGELNTTVEEQEKELAEPFSGDKAGMVPPATSEEQAKFLRGDGEWAMPPGDGGTSDYEDLTNKPAIDGTELTKNSTAEDLGLAKAPTEITGTLTAGETSIILSNDAIAASSTIDVYTDGDVDYVSVTPGTGSITITFEEQQADLGVKVRVS